MQLVLLESLSLHPSYNVRNKLLRLKKLGRGCLLSVIVPLPILLTGCVTEIFSGVSAAGTLGSAYFGYLSKEKGEPVIVTPDLEDYSKDIQSMASTELKTMLPPCPREGVAKDCSVVHRMVIDYGDLRRKIRASKDDD